MKISISLMASAIAACSLFFCHVAVAHADAEAEAAAATHIPSLRLYPADEALSQRGIRIAYVEADVSPGNGRYQCGALTGAALDKAAQIATRVYTALPVSAWQRIDMRYLLLCSHAAAAGREIGGIPVPPIKLLMLSAGRNPSATSRYPFTLMHELFHLIEMQQNSYQDADWNERFGGYTNQYGAKAGSTDLGSGGAGFINGYGASFAHEERAELFAVHMLTRRALADHIAKTSDKKLQEKYQALITKCRRLLGQNGC